MQADSAAEAPASQASTGDKGAEKAEALKLAQAKLKATPGVPRAIRQRAAQAAKRHITQGGSKKADEDSDKVRRYSVSLSFSW